MKEFCRDYSHVCASSINDLAVSERRFHSFPDVLYRFIISMRVSWIKYFLKIVSALGYEKQPSLQVAVSEEVDAIEVAVRIGEPISCFSFAIEWVFRGY